MQDKMLRLCLGAAAVPAAVLLCWLAPAGAAGLLLASLSTYWVRSCVACQPWRAAAAEAIWAACVLVGVGAGLRSVAAAVCFCVGTGVGTWLMVRHGR
jgi:hypothetical protein